MLVAVVVLIGGVVSSLWASKKLSGETLCANPGSCGALPSLAIENGSVGTFSGVEITSPEVTLASEQKPSKVLGEKTSEGEKRIYVNLETQTLSAYEGDKLILETLVSTGKWGRTPPGEYNIWVKMRATRMSGGSGNDAYDLPNVPYVMFFYSKDVPKIAGYSLHGAYWHNNFGHTMSHGCVNMREVDAKIIYDWASPSTEGNITYADAQNTGTKVIIF